jgi:hypothetical protein
MAKRYIRSQWDVEWDKFAALGIKRGDYVVATKYKDGDPGDHFCVGFYDRALDYDHVRHLVVDGDGKQFRNNGFRRVARVGKQRGEWMVRHLALIEQLQDRYSVWHWYRAPWRELDAAAADSLEAPVRIRIGRRA